MEILDPIVELKKTKLWGYLSDIDSDFAERSIRFLSGIADLLASIKDYFPFYTRHDAHHGYRVLNRIEQIVDAKCFEKNSPLKFSQQEAYLLICSAYAHDLGMALFPDEEDELLQKLGVSKIEKWEENPNLQRHLRDNHAIRGGSYINRHSESLLIPNNLIILLDLQMKAHNFSLKEIEVELGKGFAAGEKEIDIKQLACILRRCWCSIRHT